MCGDQAALSWALEWLGGHGRNCSSTLVSEQPWARVHRLSSPQYVLYLKQTVPEFHIEARLQCWIARELKAPVVAPVAQNDALGVFLSRDAGLLLRVLYQQDRGVGPLSVIMPRYAEIQVEASKRLSDLEALGVPDWRLSRFPELFSEMLDDKDFNVGLEESFVTALARTEGALRRVCETLDIFEIPPSLDHGDFNDGNIFVANRIVSDGYAVIADWGESVITHPFLSVVNFVTNFRRRHGATSCESPLDRVQGAYLSRWLDYASPAEMEKAMHVAALIYPVRYALAFHRLCKACPEGSMRHRHGWSKPALEQWLRFAAQNT